MHNHQTKGYSQYGAQMGRRSDLARDTTDALTVRRVPLDNGGYDPGGAYWGAPDDLYSVESAVTGEIAYLRADSIEAAQAQFPNATFAPIQHSDADVSDMLETYTRAALFSSNDESSDPLDMHYSADDIAPEALATMRADCAKFLAENGADVGERVADAGHDFWMTRNRHGVGFWEVPDWEWNAGQRLTSAARTFGEVNLYVGDDGKIYQG
jgi:hypothetical protein